MKTLNLGKSNFSVPKIAVSCANLNNLDKRNAEMFLSGALELGVNFFEHSDIYGRGSCEERFADAAHMSASVCEKYIIQTNKKQALSIMKLLAFNLLSPNLFLLARTRFIVS